MEASERESILNFNDGERQASFYTCHRGWMTKLERLGLKPVETTYHANGRVHTKEYLFPKGWVKIRKTKKLTGEALKKARERGLKLAEFSKKKGEAKK